MRDRSHAQLSLFDTSSLSSGGAADLFWGELEGEEGSAPLSASVPLIIPRTDYRLVGPRYLGANWKDRARDNIVAIRLLGELEREDRAATTAEQDLLIRFTGFGAGDLANSLFPHGEDGFRAGWEDIGRALHDSTTDAERAGLMRATQYAHYTPELMVRSLWDMVMRMGFSGGRVLEPGCGTGLFIATRPEKLEGRVAFTGIENDPLTARIARALYPNQWIRQEDFTKTLPGERYELAIGNPPFSSRTVRGADTIGRLRLSLHDHFIARSVEALRPGGIAVFVTSRHTLDRRDGTARTHIAAMADLLGAVRLPQGAMKDEAGTEVVVDIVVLRRRMVGDVPGDEGWLETGEVPDSNHGNGALSVNRYFLDHGEQVLGAHEWTTTQFGPDYTCAPVAGIMLDCALPEALARIAPDIRFPKPETCDLTAPARRARVGTAADGAVLKEGSYYIESRVLHQIVGGVGVEVPVRKKGSTEGIFHKHARIIEALVPVRDATRAVLRAQMENRPYGRLQSDLRRAYTSFVRQFGPINLTNTTTRMNEKTGVETETQRRPNLQPFLDDPDVWLVASIENYDTEKQAGSMGPIFSERVVHAPVEPDVQTALDALAVCLHETGGVEIPRVAELLGRSEAQVINELGDAIYLDPACRAAGRDVWVTADEALSGAVRTKLKKAREAAQDDARYARNVVALEAVQPEDLRPSDITARLGAPWLPASDVSAFIAEVIGVGTTVRHTVEVAAWSLDIAPFRGKAEATSLWGTERRHAGELLLDALNQSSPKIWDVWRDADGEHRELNTKETEAAKEKLATIRQAFHNWVWSDPDRSERLVRLYNDVYNNLVPRRFDGTHLTLPGASTVISLRAHQKRVIWRIIAAGSTYMAHAVGSGKTFSMVAAVMEQRRLGLVSKPLITVPGHCLAQIAREFLMLYPTARILVADETNFEKAKRQRFLARAATGNWDAIIITHDAFRFIPTPGDFESALIAEQVASYEELLETLDRDDTLSRKRVERMKEGMESRLEGLATRKDDLLHIGEIGIDQILVDEAQLFRKLSFATNQSDLKGVDPNGSQRAWDLFVKSRFIARDNPDRALVLASGSPITNTLGEMYTVQRYMQLSALEERGLHEFDAWAANFGETRTELELQPSGLYKPVTRFSEFVNVADLMAMYRSFADVVLPDDLRQHVKLPNVRGGRREIVVAPSNDSFKAYQQTLAQRITAIENRTGRPKKGDDILLSVITDARHAGIDLRFVVPGMESDPTSKLNIMIANVFRIWRETSENRYTDPETGAPYDLPGATQMIFSDLGTESALEKRGFSAYSWIRDELIRLGVPREQIAFMQHYKKSAAKQRLFADLNSGRRRILIGSTATMGTGVNAQQRLKALHHLDVPWLVADIIQREGRIERQGNQNDEIEIYAYAQKGSVDATNWQMLERKQRFICLAMSGDRTIRRLEDVGAEANQFAMAKALASGDERLLRKAGLEAELARLERLYAAHYDDQFNVKRAVRNAEKEIAAMEGLIPKIEADIARRRPTRGEAFGLETARSIITAREKAGAYLLSQIRMAARNGDDGEWRLGRIGGFDVMCEARATYAVDNRKKEADVTLYLALEQGGGAVHLDDEVKPLGLVSRIEHLLLTFEDALRSAISRRDGAQGRMPAYRARIGTPFAEQALLEEKREALEALEADLAATVMDTPANDDAVEAVTDLAA
ncbi:Modification methylase TaqI [Gluconacetobacter sp. SXCC-1]|uniref:methyltransferase n=1 Tax=Komagataeibacter rhaeticus TaxID=215221 RepID=UPI000207FC7E|nr:methyltransferase [Komagataeibacter rhaeticus]EGG79265.1 Modification methylase TaqI [Gluconacetobacter sp. SXCC-1]